MPRREPSIRNFKSTPPSGGWNLTYQPPEHPYLTVEAVGHSYTDVLDTIRKWRLNNGLPASDHEVFQWANAQWCQRDPVRCTAASAEAHAGPAQVAGTGQRILTPADYGRACWSFLNTFGVVFDQARFLATIEQVKALLNPVNSSGCPSCHAHFRDFQSTNPPHMVTDAAQAARWVWAAHDQANVWAGKPHRPSFQLCATLFGWEPTA